MQNLPAAFVEGVVGHRVAIRRERLRRREIACVSCDLADSRRPDVTLLKSAGGWARSHEKIQSVIP